jgi:hypothetical protein
MGAAARSYAETAFDIVTIGNRFEAILADVLRLRCEPSEQPVGVVGGRER